MADVFSKKKRSEVMSRIRSRRTGPELAVHGALNGRRARHRMWPELYGRPDILVLPRTVVFVNGCFWHGCGKHFRCPKTNRAFWALKVKRNAERQKFVARELRKQGWIVMVIWEHELKRENVEKVVTRILKKGRKK